MHMSELYVPTLRHDPSDAEIDSHRLLIRAGLIRKVSSGIYTFLPLGFRILKKIENIVRREMDDTGALEILMPVLQPGELWEESGRWNQYGPELMRLNDRHDHDVCLGPTHEELITDLVRNELRSYKQLPLCLYQIQVKFRDEIRPRFGLLRTREFMMKDAYSFHADQASLDKTYEEMGQAYERICMSCGLDFRPVEADSGQIGGKVTTEYMALADSGEAEIVYCSCGFAANSEAGECIAEPILYSNDGIKKIATPDVHTIADLARFLDVPESATVKALSGKDAEGNLIVLFIPGEHELTMVNVNRMVSGFELLTDEEMVAFGLHKGSMGPVGLPKEARVIADISLEKVPAWVVGANEEGYHYVGARIGEDFRVDEWADLSIVKPGDRCPRCGLKLEGARGIEVAQIFQLGDKYSSSMNATFMDEDGKEKPFLMGCYGVGITRTLAAIVEQHHDEAGIIWPMSVAPAQLCIIPLTVGDDYVYPTARRMAEEIAALGIEVVIDDRDERAGVKFADADLIGWPLQVIIGKRGLSEGNVEIKLRATGLKRDLHLSQFLEFMSYVRSRIKRQTGDFINFDLLFGQFMGSSVTAK
ncbi:MAG: proline--tRNA ligase [Eggerthellaceae bacterium]|nr:proline--tRNA ligase [Eggerthellaceae bacterium]